MPGWTLVGDLVAHEQELAVGQGATPDPTLSMCQVRRVGNGQSQVLFEESEHVLDGKSPQVDASQVNQGHRDRSGPEQIEWTLKAGRAVGLEELDADHHPHQERQLVEMQPFPSQQAHRLPQ
jgi:hypothetical protein